MTMITNSSSVPIYDLCDYVSGQRFHPDWTRVGGLMQDLPDEQVFLKLCRRSVEDVKRTMDDLEGLGIL
jgi:NADH:ubiquinone oxidoreductase 49 kD subunit 7